MSHLRKAVIVWARYVATLVIFVLSIIYLYINRSQLTVLSSLNTFDVLLVALLTLVYIVITGYTFAMLVNLVNTRLSLFEAIALSFLTNFGNYLGPTRPGAAFKAIYLKATKDLPYSRFSAVLAANLFLLFFVSGVTGIVLLLFLWLQISHLPLSLIIICFVLIVVSIIPLVVHLPKVHSQGRLWQIINEARLGLESIRSEKRKLIAICGILLLQYILAALVMVVAYRAFGQTLSFTLALIIGVFITISNIFTITPNNFGIQEIIMAYLYTLTGLNFADGLLGAGLMRAVHILLTFGLGPIFIHFMLKSANLSLSAILPGQSNTTDSFMVHRGESQN